MLLDGTLKLRHCTEFFTMRFPPWSLPKVGYGSGKRLSVTPGHLLDEGSNTGERVRLTRKTRPGASSHSGSRASNAEEMEKIAPPPLLRSEGGARWANLAIFFLDLGLGEVLLWGRLEPAFGGKQV